MRKPDFFVLGAPKCGTTSMYEYLRADPQIFMPEIKEPNYFCSDLSYPRRMTETQYLALFQGARSDQRVGEASPWYLFSEVAAEAIVHFAPEAQAIAMLRNPVDVVISLHQQRLVNGNEDIEDLVQALDAEPDRAQGRRLPSNPHPIEALVYTDVPRFGRQLERAFAAFGRDRVHVILFDEFVSAPDMVFRGTLEFLGLEMMHKPEFVAHNRRAGVRSPMLRSWINDSHFPARDAIRRMIGPRRARAIRKWLLAANTKPIEPSVEPAVRARLASVFRDEVAALGTLIGRDLSTWVSKD